MHKIKTQRLGELFVKNMLTIYFNMVIVKQYKVKKIFFKFRESDCWNEFRVMSESLEFYIP